jgi:glucokinase
VTLLGALELGGSHVSAARITERDVVSGSLIRRSLAASGGREELLATILQAVREANAPGVSAWGVATPGPFDYERGIVTIRGVGKLESLYGVDLRRSLADALRFEAPERIRFLNDASAFLLGEWLAGLAVGHPTAMGITLGTGLGSAFLRDGRIVEDGRGVPREGRLDLVPFRGGAVEETISARGLAGLLAARGADPDAARAADGARRGDHRAEGAFASFGAALGEFLEPWLAAFAPSCLVVGGSIARSWDLIEPSFTAAASTVDRLAACGVAERLGEAALIGAAQHAAREAQRLRRGPAL